jgi:non-ribosomal peptide synthetase-like protein
VAYVVPANGGPEPDFDEMARRLRERLPPYMVPAAFEAIEALPVLPSGKVDRKRLPSPTKARTARGGSVVAPRTQAERTVAALWANLFQRDQVSVTDDFFLDLGGHSLFAATAASRLRTMAGFESVSVSDLYRSPTVEKLAASVELRSPAVAAASQPEAPLRHAPVSPRLHRRGGALQALGIYAIQLLVFYPLLLLALSTGAGASPATLMLLAVVAAVTYFPVMLAIALAVKWTVVGRYRPGRYPLWGGYYLRWWFVRHVNALVPLQWISGTPLMPAYCRLMGARVGKDVQIDTVFMQAFDLLSIGDGTSVNLDAQITGYAVEGGELIIGPVEVGRRCFVGAHSVVAPGASMEDGASLAEHSLLPTGATARAGTFYAGSPAEAQAAPPPGFFGPEQPAPYPARLRRVGIAAGHVAGAALLALVPLVASLPGLFVFVQLFALYGYLALLASPLVAVLFVGTFVLETAAVKWALLGRVAPGWYATTTGFYLRKWFVDRVLHLNFIFLNSLFSTLYALLYFRLLGARLGPNAEVERVSHVAPDLLTLKPGSFIADAVYLGAPRTARGRTLVAETEVGTRTFIGNSALLPADHKVADGCLVGVQSVPPSDAPEGTSWLGSPPLALPRRDVNRNFAEEQTFAPTRRLRAARYFIEFFRILVPSTLLVAVVGGTFLVVRALLGSLPAVAVVALFPAVILGAQVLALLAAAAVKRVVIGRYRPRIAPLWSLFVWRTELVTGTYEGPAAQMLLVTLTGTPFLGPAWRLFGVGAGKRIFADTTHITEFDFVTIGDESALNLNCGLQTHLFEDRVMKLSYLHVGRACAVGCNSIVLYDTRMEDGSRLGPLSLLMKGESLPPSTAWEGIPAKRAPVRGGVSG